MTSIRSLVAGTVAGALALAAVVPAASARDLGRAYPGEGYSQYYYGPGYYRRGPSGGAVAAGVIGGLAVGALAGAAIANSGPRPYPGQPVGNVYGADPNWINYCASRYRSFDPASGTYLARDGNRYYCQ